MSKRRKKEKLKRRERRIKNRVKLRTLFLVAITLIFNTYAWFLYVHSVSGDLKVHVEAWQVQFQVDGQIVQRDFVFDIAHAYPGMTQVSKTVSIANAGEKDADIGYKIKSIRLFDQVYISSEAVAEGATVPTGANTSFTEAQLLSKIQNDFPFTVSFTNSATINAGQSGSLTMAFSWPFESGDDAADTSYGTDAYDFYTNNVNQDRALEIVIVIVAQQHNGT